ncbi:MAG: hypothetical protein ACKVOA_07615, partial [Methylophilaceae bacterium]
MDKNLTCSIVALEIIDFSKKAIAEQSEIKKQLDDLINRALIDVPELDRVITQTEQGALIAFTGQLEDALDDALLVSLTVRDEILKNNTQSLKPIYVQFGLNLGALNVINKKQRQIISGDGVDEAYRIMSFANPNQILVSRAYHEIASNLTQEMAKMFEPYDMHAHDEEVYAVRRLADQANIDSGADVAEEIAKHNWQLTASKIGWKKAAIGLLAFVAIFVLGKRILMPIEPNIVMDPPTLAEEVKKPEAKSEKQSVQVAAPLKKDNTAVVTVQEEPSKAEEEPVKATQKKVAQKKITQKPAVEPEMAASSPTKPEKYSTEMSTVVAKEKHQVTAETMSTETKTEKKLNSEKSSWQAFKESVKTGAEHACTQAESAL